MITGGLSCDRVEFGHFGGGQMTPPTPPLLRACFVYTEHAKFQKASFNSN